MPGYKQIALFGYSGHAYVVIDIFKSNKKQIVGYFTSSPVENNPYGLDYLGFETNPSDLDKILGSPYFVAVGYNQVREKITITVQNYLQYPPLNAIHKNASVSKTAAVGNGVVIGDHVVVNACSILGNGVICNTGSIIEHECIIGDFTHIAPGVVLCGNVKVGKSTLIGAGSAIIPNITIGDNVVIGAGTTVIRDIPANSKVVGKPQRFIQ